MPKLGRMFLRIAPCAVLPFIMNFPAVSYGFWPTVLSVAPLLRDVVCLSVSLSVCLSSVCDVLYPGETVRLS